MVLALVPRAVLITRPFALPTCAAPTFHSSVAMVNAKLRRSTAALMGPTAMELAYAAMGRAAHKGRRCAVITSASMVRGAVAVVLPTVAVIAAITLPMRRALTTRAAIPTRPATTHAAVLTKYALTACVVLVLLCHPIHAVACVVL